MIFSYFGSMIVVLVPQKCFLFCGHLCTNFGASHVVLMLKEPTSNLRDESLILGSKDPLGERMATHPSVLAWRVPWTEEPGRLQSIESHRVGYTRNDLAGYVQI